MEHWLPLFGAPLVGLDSYLPQAVITLDHQADEAKRARLDTITDFYSARADLQRAEQESGARCLQAAAAQPALPRPMPIGRTSRGGIRSLPSIISATGQRRPALQASGAPGLNFAEARINPGHQCL